MASGLKWGEDDDALITEINVTPFVDVVLVLLILFMLAAPAVYQNAFRIALPAAASPAESVERVTLRFFVEASGALRLDERPVAEAEIPALVERARRHDPGVDAVVYADRKAEHGALVGLIDALRAAGVAQIGLGVERR
jgi:biopolymer transport protein ExbD